MRSGSVCVACVACIACMVASPSVASAAAPATAPQWGIDGTTIVRGGEALPDHVIVVVSAWCTYVDDPAVWKEVDSFYGEPEAPPTVGDNLYGCTYDVVEDGEALAGAPWDAPDARDDVVYALPRAKFPVDRRAIAALDGIPVAAFYPRMESGKDGVLRASVGPSRGLRVPGDSPLIGFEDTLRAALRDGTFTLVAEQRAWKLRDGREAVEPLGDEAPPEPSPVPEVISGSKPDPAVISGSKPEPAVTPESAPVPAVIPAPAPVPAVTPAPAPGPAVTPRPAPVPEGAPEAAPVPEVISAPPAGARPPSTATPSRALDAAIGAGCLVLGLLGGLGIRRRR